MMGPCIKSICLSIPICVATSYLCCNNCNPILMLHRWTTTAQPQNTKCAALAFNLHNFCCTDDIKQWQYSVYICYSTHVHVQFRNNTRNAMRIMEIPLNRIIDKCNAFLVADKCGSFSIVTTFGCKAQFFTYVQDLTHYGDQCLNCISIVQRKSITEGSGCLLSSIRFFEPHLPNAHINTY